MKRCLLVFSLVLVFALLLGACAADEFVAAPADALDMALWADELPAPADASDDFIFAPAESVPDFDFEVADAAPAPDIPAAPSASGRGAADSTGSPGPSPILTPSNSNGRRLVYTVNMHLQTTDFMSGIRLLYDTISELNGFIMRETVQGRDLRTPEVERSASYTIRLYTDNLPDFIVVMEDNFNLLNRHTEADDVTASYEHAGLTLADMREHEQRLMDELGDPDLEVYEQLDLQSALAEVQSYIRNLETHLSATDDDILFSFIDLLLFEVVIPEEVEEEEEVGVEEVVELTFGERFNNAALSSWAGFIGFGQGLLIVIIRILPTLLILGALTVVVVIIVRYIKKRRKQNPRQKRQKATGAEAHTGYQNWNNNAQWNQYNPNAGYSDPSSTGNNNAAQNFTPSDNDPNASSGNGA